MIPDRETLIRRGWEAIVSGLEGPTLGGGRFPHTLGWLWDFAPVAANNAHLLRLHNAEQLEAWVHERAAKEGRFGAHPIERVMDICTELKVWDLDLQLPITTRFDEHARLALGAVARTALTAMAQAVRDAEGALAPGVWAMVQLAEEAKDAATVEALNREGVGTGEFARVLGERRNRAGHLVEAIAACLAGEGILDPEDVARVLISQVRKGVQE